MPTATVSPRTLTIRETAEATGLTVKAVRNRVDRGTLPAVVRDGRRRIPVTELERAGLFEAANGGAMRHEVPRGTPAEAGASEATLTGLIDRLEHQAEELGRLRALTERAETLKSQEHDHAERLEAELIELRATVAAFELREQQHGRWWRIRRRQHP